MPCCPSKWMQAPSPRSESPLEMGASLTSLLSMEPSSGLRPGHVYPHGIIVRSRNALLPILQQRGWGVNFWNVLKQQSLEMSASCNTRQLMLISMGDGWFPQDNSGKQEQTAEFIQLCVLGSKFSCSDEVKFSVILCYSRHLMRMYLCCGVYAFFTWTRCICRSQGPWNRKK